MLAVENNPAIAPWIRTPLPTDGGLIAPYYAFRKSFTLDVDPGTLTLLVSNLVDDGAIFYLNGMELFRFNMPSGSTPSGARAERSWRREA